MLLPPLRSRARLAALLLLMLAPVASALADAFPALPLPDCFANGLTPGAFVDCEGTLAGYANIPAVPRPAQGEVALGISTRTADFRLDADGPTNGQFITFSFTFPGQKQGPGPDGSTYRSHARVADWPAEIEDFNGAYVDCRDTTAGSVWGAGCDANPVGTGANPPRFLLERQGACPLTSPSCTYRVTWGPYDRRVRQPMIFRVHLSWTVLYVEDFPDPMPDNRDCQAFSLEGECVLGGGNSYVTFATTPPPPLDAVGVARRRGAKAFEFDATASHSDVVSYEWTLQFPTTTSQNSTIVTSNQSVFDFDFGTQANIPATFFETAPSAKLQVVDRWGRAAFDFPEYSFLEPAGSDGALQIVSLVLVDVDEDGVATLKAVVKNTTNDPITDAYIIGKAGGLAPDSSPQSVTIAGNATVEFTITVKFDTSPQLTVEAKAFGTSNIGPVKSAPKSKQFTRDGTVIATTTVAQASQPGDTTLHVAANDGFEAGQYALVNLPGANVEIRQIQALGSLIFSVPLAKAHAVGEPVQVFANIPPNGDIVPPTVVVTSPAAGAFVCQGAALTAAFTCNDPALSVGLEQCGGGIVSGQPLDTSTSGAKTTTVRAWDLFGNLTEKTVAWSVGPCGAIDAFQCFKSKADVPKFAPIVGVRAQGGVDDLLVDLKKRLALCTPADTTADGLLDDATHLEAYAIKPAKGQKPVPQTGLEVLSQLGALKIDTAKPAQLLLPTAEDPTTTPTLTVNGVDRFLCRSAKLAKGQTKLAKDLQVTVAGAFSDPPKRFLVKKLVRYCAPVGVDGGPTKHDTQLLCLQVAPTKGRCADAAPSNAGGGCKKETECGGTKGQTTFCVVQAKFGAHPRLNVVNDLDQGTLDAVKEDLLCLPAVLAKSRERSTSAVSP